MKYAFYTVAIVVLIAWLMGCSTHPTIQDAIDACYGDLKAFYQDIEGKETGFVCDEK